MPLENGALLNGRYLIERVLGQGGFGAVYLAVDQSLDTLCAVKENLNASPEAERQFRREATLLATLRHPNLPRVTNHFVLGGQQYLVMDYVEGEDVKDRVEREGPLPEPDVLRWAKQICGALAYLHGLTPPVIHRDIKPDNIKITPSGEAILVDFGIAKAETADQRTATGALGLTPGFAPPEQYSTGHTDARTDVYALAATLYNLLTGQVPPDSVERLIEQATLTAPEQLRPDLSLNVSAALKQALEISADNRFPGIPAFLAALENPAFTFTPRATPTKQAVALTRPAPPATATEPAKKKFRWRGLLIAGCLALLAIVVVFFVTIGIAAYEAVLTFAGLANSAFYSPTPRPVVIVTSVIEVTATFTPGPALVTTPTITPTATPAGPSTATPAPRQVAADNAQYWRLYANWLPADPSVPFALSPDGKNVALPVEQGVDIFDLATGQTVKRLQGFIINRRVQRIAYSRETLLVQFADEVIQWDIASNSLIERFKVPGRDLVVSPDGSLMAVREQFIHVINLDTGQLIRNLGDEDSNQHFAFSPDGKLLALAVSNNAELWDMQTGQRVRTVFGHGEPTLGLTFTGDSAKLISAGGDVWDVNTGDLLTIFDSSTVNVAVDPGGQIIVGDDGSVWELATGNLIGTIPGGGSNVSRMQFTPDGLFLIRQESGNDIQLWSVDPNGILALAPSPTLIPTPAREAISPLNVPRLAALMQIGQIQPRRMALSPNGKAVAGWSGSSVAVVDLATGSLVAQFQTSGTVADAAYLSDNFLLVINSRQGVERWEISTQRLKQSYDVTGDKIVASPDGKLFAVQEERIQVVDVVTGKLLYKLDTANSGHDFVFAPDGSSLGIAAGSGIAFWDMATGRQARQLGGHGPQTRSLVFTPNGQRLVSASGDVWDFATGKLIAVFESSTNVVAVSPDGKLIAGSNGSLWDGNAGQYLGKLDFSATQLMFTPDNQYLVVYGGGAVTAYGIEPVVAHTRPPTSNIQPPDLQTLATANAPDLDLLGWWGDDALLNVRLLRDAPQSGARSFGDQASKQITLSPDGKTFTALTGDGIDLLDPATGQLVDQYRLFLNPATIQEVAYLGEHLLVLKDRAGVERWNLETQLLEQRYNVGGQALVASPDGKFFALQKDDSVQVVDAASGEVAYKLRVARGLQEYQFSPDGKFLAVTTGTFVELWDLATGKRAANLRGHSGRVYSIAFAPDGERLIAASGDIWNVADGTLLAQFDNTANVVAVSADGSFFVGDDGSFWETATGRRMTMLFDLRQLPRQMLFTSDGKQLIWRTVDDRIYIFGARPETPVATATPAPNAVNPANAAQLRLQTHLNRGRLINAHWSLDGKYLAVNTSQNVVIYEGASLKRIRAYLDAAALAFDGENHLLIGGAQPLQLVDVVTGEVVKSFGQTGITIAAFSPDGTRSVLAIGGQVEPGGNADGVIVIDLSDGLEHVIDEGRGRYKEVIGLAFSPDSRRLVVSFPGEISIWNLETYNPVRVPVVGNTRRALISPDGKYIAYFTNRFVIENLENGAFLRAIKADGTPFFPTGLDDPSYVPIDYAFTRNGKLLVYYRQINRRNGIEYVSLIEWDLDEVLSPTQIKIDRLLRLSAISGLYFDDYANDRAHRTPAFGLSPAENYLVSLTGDGVVRVWNYDGGAMLAEGKPDYLPVFAISPDSRQVAVPSALGDIDLIDLATGEVVKTLKGPFYPARLMYNSPSILMVWHSEDRLSFVDVADGKIVEAYSGGLYKDSRFPALSPDGRLFAMWSRITSRDGVNVFSLAPDRFLFRLGGFTRPDHILFSPDGQTLAVIKGKKVEVWNLQTRQLALSLDGIGQTIGPLVFTPDGSRLIAATGEIWTLADGTLTTFDSTTDAIVLSPDGQVIVGRDGTMWNANTGQPIDVLQGFRGPAVNFAFTPDGRQLIWQNDDGVIEVWRLP